VTSQRRVADVCWRNLAVLLGCAGWGLAAVTVEQAIGRGEPLGWLHGQMSTFLLVAVIWQVAVGNADASPTPAGAHLCRRQVVRSVLAQASGGAIGLVLLVRLGAPAPLVAEAVGITVVAAAAGLAGLVVVCHFRSVLARRRLRQSQSVIVYGARGLGRACVDAIRCGSHGRGTRIAFVDDDPSLRWREVCGCPVIGSGADLRRLAWERHATQVVVAFANPDPGRITDLQRLLAASGAQLSIFRRGDEPGAQWRISVAGALPQG